MTVVRLLCAVIWLAAASFAPAGAQASAEPELKREARHLIELAERARSVLLAIEEALERLRARAAQLEAQLAEGPIAPGEMSQEQARQAIAQLRGEIEALQGEAPGTSFAELHERSELIVTDALKRFSEQRPDIAAVAALLGPPANPPPAGMSCGEDLRAAELVVCRTQSLADLDRTLESLFERAQATARGGRLELLVRQQNEFRSALQICAMDLASLMAPDGPRQAIGCLQSRYGARIAALRSEHVEAPRGQGGLAVLHDTDLFGHDYLRQTGATLQSCQSACQDDARCMAFTYNRQHAVCFLKSDAEIGVRNDIAVSGHKEQVGDRLYLSRMELLYGVDMAGGDYQDFRGSLGECVRACSDDNVCTAFSWIGRDSWCGLKLGTPGRRPNQGVTSGIKGRQ